MANLMKLAIGFREDNAELTEKRKNGEYQLWKNWKRGKGYCVVRIVNNKYEVLVKRWHPQKTARIVFDYYAPPLEELEQTD